MRFLRYNDDHRASLARSILAGKRRLYYATPEDFSYQVVQDDKYHLDDTAALENYFMGPHIRKLDASIRDKPDELSAAWVRNQRNAKLNVILMAEDLIDRPGRVAALRATVQSELEDALHEITVRHRELAQGG